MIWKAYTGVILSAFGDCGNHIASDDEKNEAGEIEGPEALDRGWSF